jgi:UDP-3-O-[3-hydroxymyristoyl] glucosamine N-acyltransferase
MGSQMEQVNKIHPSAFVYEQYTKMKDSVALGEYSIVGKPGLEPTNYTVIDRNVSIGGHAIIYSGVSIGESTQIEDFCRIGESTSIGSNCRIVYGAKIYGYVKIGSNCVIGGFICEEVKIGNNCRIFGQLVHAHKVNPMDFADMQQWDKGEEPAPTIEDNVFIAFGAIISGGITIGKGSFILPNAIVTKNIPPGSLVKDINIVSQFQPFS